MVNKTVVTMQSYSTSTSLTRVKACVFTQRESISGLCEIKY